MTPQEKSTAYETVISRIDLLLDGSCDWISAMSTVACELHNAFDYFDWTGFYRTVRSSHLQVGPYQGGHGCIDIPFANGVCGAAATTKTTKLVRDVSTFPGHIDCSATTRSEIVVPILSASGEVVAVLDVDSDRAAAFDEIDKQALERLCKNLGDRFGLEAERSIGS